MSWKKRHLEGSYKGVPFSVQAHEMAFGRRNKVTEYFSGEKADSEDLGLKSKSYTVEAFVIGLDYDLHRDDLIAAIESPGSGKLIHPYLGELFVSVSECSLKESREEGGIARFTLEFVEGQEDKGLVVVSVAEDPISLLPETVNELEDSSVGYFSEFINVLNQPSYIVGSVSSKFDEVLELVEKVTLPIQAAIEAVSRFKRDLYRLKSKGEAAFSDISKLADDVRSLFELIPETEPSSIHISRDLDKIIKYEAKVDTIRIRTTERSIIELVNAKNVEVFANTLTLAALVKCVANDNNLTRESQEYLRNKIIDSVDFISEKYFSLEEIQVQSGSIPDVDLVVQKLFELRRVIVSMLTLDEINVKTLKSAEHKSSLELISEFDGDLEQEGKFLRENNVEHPGFINGEVSYYE